MARGRAAGRWEERTRSPCRRLGSLRGERKAVPIPITGTLRSPAVDLGPLTALHTSQQVNFMACNSVFIKPLKKTQG